MDKKRELETELQTTSAMQTLKKEEEVTHYIDNI